MSKKIKKQSPLTSKQARYLRGLGHHLTPLAMIGREGISTTLVKSVQDILKAHELVKVRVQNNCPQGRKEAAAELAERTGAQVAQVIGKTFLLFRANPDLPPDKKITLP